MLFYVLNSQHYLRFSKNPLVLLKCLKFSTPPAHLLLLSRGFDLDVLTVQLPIIPTTPCTHSVHIHTSISLISVSVSLSLTCISRCLCLPYPLTQWHRFDIELFWRRMLPHSFADEHMGWGWGVSSICEREFLNEEPVSRGIFLNSKRIQETRSDLSTDSPFALSGSSSHEIKQSVKACTIQLLCSVCLTDVISVLLCNSFYGRACLCCCVCKL